MKNYVPKFDVYEERLQLKQVVGKYNLPDFLNDLDIYYSDKYYSLGWRQRREQCIYSLLFVIDPEYQTDNVTQTYDFAIIEVPKNTVDYFKVWLTKTFPLLTAPLFQPVLIERRITKTIEKETKYKTIYIGKDSESIVVPRYLED